MIVEACAAKYVAPVALSFQKISVYDTGFGQASFFNQNSC